MGKNWKSGPLHIWPNKLVKGGPPTASHRHPFGHTTFVMSGMIRVKIIAPDGKRTTHDLIAPAEAYVPPMFFHELAAISDTAEYWCVFYDEAPDNG